MQLEELKNRISLIEYLEKRGLKLEKAGQNVYRINPCPICGHKDHFTVYPSTNSYTSFSGCCNGGSIIDYLIEVEGMAQVQAIEKLKKIAGFDNEGPGIINNSKENINIEEEPKVVKLNDSEKKEIALLVMKASQNSTDYYIKRGLTLKTINKYRLGYLPDGHKFGKSFQYVLPVSEQFVVLRSNNEEDRYRNIGNTEILNLRYIEDETLTDKQIFITEGYFDALSLEELDFHAVGLNSTAMSDTLLKNIAANKAKLKDKQFILALDNDQGGRETAAKLKRALSELGLLFTEMKIESYKDINEYLLKDREGLQKTIESLPLKGTIYDYLSEGFELDQIRRLSEPEIKTGIESLDYNLGGGLYPGLYVLGAISSLGKTALALQLADRVAAQHRQVLFFSLEMGRYEMTCRSLARVLFEQGGAKDLSTGNVLKTTYKGQDIFNQDYFQLALSKYKDTAAKYLTIEEGNFDLDIHMLRQQVIEHIGRTGQNPVIIVDYLQVLRPVDMRITEKQHIDMTIVELKRLSRDLDVPVVAVSSFNRANYKTDVTFEAFKESGAIEYTADVVLAMQLRKNGEEDINKIKNMEPRPLELVLLKNRRGRAYDVINLDYWPKQNYFAEV
jgi:replicative DNA helicase